MTTTIGNATMHKQKDYSKTARIVSRINFVGDNEQLRSKYKHFVRYRFACKSSSHTIHMHKNNRPHTCMCTCVIFAFSAHLGMREGVPVKHLYRASRMV